MDAVAVPFDPVLLDLPDELHTERLVLRPPRAGQRATFAVGVAATSTPVTYQWLRDGGSIAGATGPGYETPPTVASDDGARFSVRVCNDRVCVLSDSAVLTVVP